MKTLPKEIWLKILKIKWWDYRKKVLKNMLEREIDEYYDEPFYNKRVGYLNWVVWRSETRGFEVLIYYTFKDGDLYFIK